MMPLFEFPEHTPESLWLVLCACVRDDIIIMMNRGGLWQGITGAGIMKRRRAANRRAANKRSYGYSQPYDSQPYAGIMATSTVGVAFRKLLSKINNQSQRIFSNE